MGNKQQTFKAECIDYIKSEDGKTNKYIHYSYKEVPISLKKEFQEKFLNKKISSKDIEDFLEE